MLLCKKKWDLVLLKGEIKFCIFVWTNLQGDWTNMIEEINFVGFWVGCWLLFSSPQLSQLILKS